MIRFKCDQCEQKIKVPVEYANKSVKCPACSNPVKVPPVPADNETLQPVTTPVQIEERGDNIWSDDLLTMSEPATEKPSQRAGSACHRCGAALPEDAHCCIECGARMEVHEPEPGIRTAQPVVKKAIVKAAGFPLAVGLSFAGAMVGSLIWALIGYFANLEIGWIAVGIGVLSGLGATIATSERSVKLGLVAGCMAVIGILAGKLIIIQWSVKDVANELRNNPPQEIITAMKTDEEGLFNLGCREMVDQGTITEDMADILRVCYIRNDIEETPELKAARQQVLAEMQTWNEQKKEEEIREFFDENADEMAQAIIENMPLSEKIANTVSLFDGLWLFLAVGTAFKMGSSK